MHVKNLHAGTRGSEMQRIMLAARIHRATVTEAELHCEASPSIDRGLLDVADLTPNAKVVVVNVNAKNRMTQATRGR